MQNTCLNWKLSNYQQGKEILVFACILTCKNIQTFSDYFRN